MTERVLGDGAAGNPEDPASTGESTIQPGLMETDEVAGATLSEQQEAQGDDKAASQPKTAAPASAPAAPSAAPNAPAPTTTPKENV